MKNALEALKDLDRQKKDSAKLKKGTERRKIEERKQSQRDLWDTIKETNIHIVGAPDREQREKGSERMFEKKIRLKNFSNFKKKMNIHIQESQQAPRKINSKRYTLRNITIKLLNSQNKERILKAMTHHIKGLLNEIISRYFV